MQLTTGPPCLYLILLLHFVLVQFTALSLACQNMRVECMELLVDEKALASYKYSKDGYVNCLSQIIEGVCKTQNPLEKKKFK